jgi:hypothetical protein
MAKKKPYLSYEEAKQYLKEQCLPSRRGYNEWWLANKPKALPRFPYRVYKDWVGWNDFLGNDNKYDFSKRSYRPLNEAVVWVHKLGITNQLDWLKYCSQHRSEMPSDIPSRPELIYSDWLSWNHWLGNKPRQKAEAQKIAQSNVIYYLIKEEFYPENVITIGVERGGRSALKDRWQRERFRVIGMFIYRSEMQGVIDNIIDQLSTPFYDNKYTRIVPNVNLLIWNFSNILERIA